MAQAVRVAARTSDVVARYGGEEFVMLAPGLDLLRGADYESLSTGRFRHSS